MFGSSREVAVMQAAKTAVGFVLGWLFVRFGLDLGPEAESGLVTFVGAVFLVALSAVQAFLTRRVVTPLADPRNDAGVPLVPANGGGQSFPGSNVVGLD